MKFPAVVSELDAVLRPFGFQHRKYTWNRVSGSFVDVVEVQLDKSGDKLSLNLGVLSPSLYEQCWGRSPDDHVQEPFCTVRTRLLDTGGNERWWSAANHHSAAEMRGELEGQGLTFIERMHSFAAMRDWLTARVSRLYPLETIYLALLDAELGNHPEACARLRKLQTRMVGDWRSKIEQVMIDLDCTRELEIDTRREP